MIRVFVCCDDETSFVRTNDLKVPSRIQIIKDTSQIYKLIKQKKKIQWTLVGTV